MADARAGADVGEGLSVQAGARQAGELDDLSKNFTRALAEVFVPNEEDPLPQGWVGFDLRADKLIRRLPLDGVPQVIVEDISMNE